MSLTIFIKKTLNLPDDIVIDDGHGPGLVDYWDSLAHVQLMTALEEHYNISIDIDEVISVTTVADLKALLADKGVTA